MPHPPRRRRARLASVVLAAALVASCGGGDADPLADGRRVFGRVCAACHGAQGQGGIGPPLASVVEDFPSCAEHVEWVTLGSAGWLDAHGDTYGATDKPVTGGMPAFGATLSAAEIAAVAAWERHRHAGAELETVLEDCGVGE
jgi:mono/diheme cytochrome c family protein